MGIRQANSLKIGRNGEERVSEMETYDVDAVIHEISPCVMPRSRPMLDVTIIPTPVRKDDVAVATVAWKTNETSWRVLLKHAGRSPKSFPAFGMAADGAVVLPLSGSPLVLLLPLPLPAPTAGTGAGAAAMALLVPMLAISSLFLALVGAIFSSAAPSSTTVAAGDEEVVLLAIVRTPP